MIIVALLLVCSASALQLAESIKAKTGFTTGTAVTQGTCQQWVGQDYYGGDMSSSPATSTTACCAACSAKPGCKAWSLAGGTCYLKNTVPNRVMDSNVITGLAAPSTTTSSSGIYVYHFIDGDTGGGWQNYNWKVMTNGVLFHYAATTDGNGQFSNMAGWPNTQLAAQAQTYNVGYHLAIAGNWQSVLLSSSAQQTLINNCVAAIKTTGGGINVDFENLDASYRTPYNTFIKNLYGALHPLGKKLTIAVPPNILYGSDGIDSVTLAQYSDGLFVMGYDFGWGSSQASANAPLPGIQNNIQAAIQAGIARNKLILGVPWYGYTYNCQSATPGTSCVTSDAWPLPAFCYQTANQSATQYGAKWDSASSTPYWEQVVNGKRSQGWFDNAQSTTLKYQYASSQQLLGVGMWYGGCGDGYADLWNALSSFKPTASFLDVEHAEARHGSLLVAN